MDNLILVESPTKARTLTRFLGGDYTIEATMGHVRDLPEKTIGVDVKHNFEPEYVVSVKRKPQADKLIKLAKGAKNIILATDPDREGEAIAWHVSQLIAPSIQLAAKRKNKKQAAGSRKQEATIVRIVFHEITEKAIKEALDNPHEIDMNLVDAQQARRILDRLVGYKLSPLLWKKIRKGLSAGRVQSVALRLIVERDREIEAFKAIEYWNVEAMLQQKLKSQNSNLKTITQNLKVDNDTSVVFKAILISKINENKNTKIEIHNKEEADKILLELEGGEWKVGEVATREVRKNPPAPFMTSTLQQAAGNKFGWSAKRTMQAAQSLYEAGFITYHRTDSLNLNTDAISIARKFISSTYGDRFVPEVPRVFKNKSKVAQEAHEAIRPTKIDNIEEVKNTLIGELGREDAKLFDLVWKRFIACQMSEAIYDQTSADILVKDYLFRATGQVTKFEGWKVLYGIEKSNTEITENTENTENFLPEITKDELLNLINLLPSQHFTEPPPKFTEASLIKSLEEKSIGRPSTYAPIISTILERRYVEKMDKKFSATVLGFAVCDFLTANFTEIMDYAFTAKMEDELDSIASGELAWVPVIKEFYEPFAKHLEQVTQTAERVKIAVEETEEKCDLCGANLVVRVGKFGKFLACSRFPNCKFTKPFLFNTGLKCLKCSGNVILRRTKRGKQFYGCSNYPKCDFASWTKPVSKGSEEGTVQALNTGNNSNET